jgi:hypothetical protein
MIYLYAVLLGLWCASIIALPWMIDALFPSKPLNSEGQS